MAMARKKPRQRIVLPSASPEPRVIGRSSLPEILGSQIRAMIQRAELAPGMPIIEAQLCQQFGMSRTPLREALKVLSAEGLVELRPHHTPIVARVDAAEIAAIFEVTVALERLAGERLASHMTADNLAELEALHREMLAFHESCDRARYGDTNRRIHLAIISYADNPVLSATYEGFSNRISRARATMNYYPRRWTESVAEHEQIMDALRLRDPQMISHALAYHAVRTGEAVIERLHEIEGNDASGCPSGT